MSKNLKQQTINTYNESAKELAEYFSGIGGQRKKFIDKIFEFVNKDNPTVLEVGCGDGREAKYILNKTEKYSGFDISEEMIKLAKDNVPGGNFFVGDLEKYSTPKRFDVVMALSSLLHSDIEAIQKFINEVGSILEDEGVFAFDLKMTASYKIDIRKDRFGIRTFYYYPQALIEKMLQKKYKILLMEEDKIGKTKWLMVIVRKK